MLLRNSFVWNELPLLRLVGPFLVGLILGLHSTWDLDVCWILGGLIGLWAMFFLIKSPLWPSSLLLMLLFMIMGWSYGCYATLKAEPSRDVWQDQIGQYRLVIIEPPQEKRKSWKTTVRIVERLLDGNRYPISDAKAIVYVSKELALKDLEVGTEWFVQARWKHFSSLQNPETFDYASYMRRRGVCFQTYLPLDAVLVIRGAKTKYLNAYFTRLREQLRQVFFKAAWTSEVKGLLGALLLGDKRDLSNDQRDSYADAGAMHVLAVSGLHVGILYLIIAASIKFIRRLTGGRFIYAMLLLISLWTFAGITGFSSSVSRAATMFSFMVVGEGIQRKSGIYNALLASALFLLVWNPYWIVEVGFQLSYSAVFGIVSLQPMIYAWLGKSRWWLIDKAWSLTSVSIAAQLATFPLALYYFHQFPSYFLLSNFLVIPIATALLPLGILYLLVSPLQEIARLIASVVGWLADAMNTGVAHIQSLPFSTIDGIHLPLHDLFFLYLLMGLGVFFLMYKNAEWLQLFLITLIFLLSSNIHQWYAHTHQKGLWFYDSQQGNMMAGIDGSSVLWLADSSFLSDQFNWQSIQEHWRSLGVKEASQNALPEDLIFHVVSDRLIAKLERIEKPEQPLEVDVLWITTPIDLHSDSVCSWFQPELVMLSKHLPLATRKSWRNLFHEKNIELVDLADRGSYYLDLSAKGIGK